MGKVGVGGVTLRKNRLIADGDRLRPQPTESTEKLPAEVVFRSVGYRGVPLPGLPFREDWAVIPSDQGRVTGDGISCGVYVGGWIKRGPTGVIGTNKPDAQETVRNMLEDIEAGHYFNPGNTNPESIDHLLQDRCRSIFRWDDWIELNRLEIAAGEPLGCPRVKFTSTERMLEALRR